MTTGAVHDRYGPCDSFNHDGTCSVCEPGKLHDPSGGEGDCEHDGTCRREAARRYSGGYQAGLKKGQRDRLLIIDNKMKATRDRDKLRDALVRSMEWLRLQALDAPCEHIQDDGPAGCEEAFGQWNAVQRGQWCPGCVASYHESTLDGIYGKGNW